MIVLVLCLIFFVRSCIKYILYERHMERYMKHIKSISRRFPLIGNIPLFVGKSMQQVYEVVIEVILQDKTPIVAQLGPAYFVVVDNPEDMKTILTSPQCFDKPYTYDFFHLPYGLATQRCKMMF